MNRLTDDFGLYLVLKQLAESGVFTKGDMSPMRSAEVADLYEAFQYLAAVRSESAFMNRLNGHK